MSELENVKTEVARHSEEIKSLGKDLISLSKSFTEMGFAIKNFMEELPKLGNKIDHLSEMFTNFTMPREEDWKTKETIKQLREQVDWMKPIVTKIQIRSQFIKENKVTLTIGCGIVILGFMALLNPEIMPHINELLKTWMSGGDTASSIPTK